MNNEQILKEVHSTFNHAKATRVLYKQAIKKYCNFHGMSLEELIEEAETEADTDTDRPHRRDLEQLRPSR